MKKTPIIDLHCDLLGCIEYSQRKLTFDSPELNCSIPQLLAGNVELQVLAVAAITGKDSATIGAGQIELYQKLRKSHRKTPRFLFGIENASTLLDEEEPLQQFFARFSACAQVENILYISLTWNQENRFGGGNLSTAGLKDDGKAVLEYLNGKNVAIDFSHTSDALAHDIIDFIHKKSLSIPLMASHSNYRAAWDDKRNLPEEIAKEIIAHKGIIGLNFVHRFVGKTPRSFMDHIEYALSIGGERAIALGADFYGGLDVPPELCPGKTATTFFPEYRNSSTYPTWIEALRPHFPESLIEKICYKNAEQFLRAHLNHVFHNID